MRKNVFPFLVLTAFMMFNCTKKSDTVTGPNSTATVSSSVIDISHTGTLGLTFGLKGADQLKRYQTFITDAAHLNITGIDVKIRKWDSTAVYSNVTVELYETANNQPTNLLAVSSIDISSLAESFTVLSAPLTYHGLTARHTYAIVLGQSNVMEAMNSGFEWCVKAVDTTICIGKYNGTNWVNESSLGDGWLKVYVNNVSGSNAYSFPAGTMVVFFDDFQRAAGLIDNGWVDMNGNGQNLVDFCDIFDDGGGAKAARIKANMNLANGDTNWTNYTFSAKFKVTTMNTLVALRFHINSNGCYSVDLSNGSTLSLNKFISGAWLPTLSLKTASYSVNTFYSLKVIVNGSNTKVYFDNSSSALIDYTDASPITFGRIAIYAYIGSTIPSQAQPGIFDDVLVTIP